MERRTALAAAAVGALLAASGVVAISTSLLDPGGDGETSAFEGPSPTTLATTTPPTAPGPVVVTETRDVFDTIVVPVADPVSSPVAPAPAAGPTASKTAKATAPPTTSAPSPPTTVPSTTSTTRPPGVPADWPDDKPIPPMPAGCQKPQLEDNGVWNCDH
jgi:hypothetical protein